MNTLVANGDGIELVIKDDDIINNITAAGTGETNRIGVYGNVLMENGGASLTIGHIDDGVTVLTAARTITANGCSSQITTTHSGRNYSSTIIDNSASGGLASSTSPLVLRPDSYVPVGLGDTEVSVGYSFYTMRDKQVRLNTLPGELFPLYAKEKPILLTPQEFKKSGEISITANDLNYDSLQDIFTPLMEGVFGVHMDNVVYELVMKAPNGTVYTEILRPDHKVPDYPEHLCGIRALQSSFDGSSPSTGLVVTTATTSPTGTGILGGNGSGSTGGTFILRSAGASRHGTTPTDPGSTTDPAAPGASDPGVTASPVSQTGPTGTTAGEKAPNALRAVVTALPGKGAHAYRLAVYDAAGRRVTLPTGASVRAKMRFELPADWKADSIFAVFRLPDGSLKAAKATYDPGSGTLSFAADTAGEFTLVSFEFHGKLYGKEFYSALETYLAAL